MSYRNVGSSCPHYRERRRSPHRTDSDALYAMGGGNTGPASSVTTNFTPYYLDKKHRREDTPVFYIQVSENIYIFKVTSWIVTCGQIRNVEHNIGVMRLASIYVTTQGTGLIFPLYSFVYSMCVQFIRKPVQVRKSQYMSGISVRIQYGTVCILSEGTQCDHIIVYRFYTLSLV